MISVCGLTRAATIGKRRGRWGPRVVTNMKPAELERKRKEPDMTQELHETTVEDRRQEAYRVAEALYRQDPDWVTFFREILGIGGVVRRLFPRPRRTWPSLSGRRSMQRFS